MDGETAGGVDLSSLGSFDFTPSWAKGGGKVTVREAPGPRRSGGERRDGGERDGGRGGAGRPQGDGPRSPFQRRPQQSGPRPQREAPPPRLDAEIKILPETKALGTIIRKIQGGTLAYKLKDLAYFFLDNPETVLLKVVPREAGARPFFQCKACGFASPSESETADHAVASHLGDYYDAEEEECEPPKGNFPCVAKCGLSGVLLGPPNIHGFAETVREMVRKNYPQMSEAQYRSHIEMVRDPEAIEEWRKGAVRRTVFRARGGGDAPSPSLTREQAEGEFRRLFLPSLVERPKHLMLTAKAALSSPDRALARAAEEALAAERRAPYAMCFALRGAFHHRNLKFFRANDARGQEFVTAVELKQFDADHAIPELAAAARFLVANPCIDKSEFPADDPEFEKRLSWLVSTGHAVAFTNGVFSAVEKYPKYGPQWKKRKTAQEKPQEPAPQEAAPQEPQQEVKDETPAQLAE